jgi:hypothetical protein
MLCCAFFIAVASASGQSAPPSPLPAERQAGDMPGNWVGTVAEIGPPSVADPPGPPPADAPPDPRVWKDARLDYTWLAPGGGAGLQINDLEAATTFAVPLPWDCAPLTFKPGLGAHLWDGSAGPGPGLPTELYDAYIDIGWRPRLTRWLFVDLVFTPGLYSDFKDFNSHTFQPRGRALAIVALSPQFQLVGGAMYVNRIMTKVLPAGGFIWNPNEETSLFCVFPQPRLARRFATSDAGQWWAYLSGEFGGGKWSFQGDDGRANVIDYTDWRVILGVELVSAPGLKGHVEVGYVFNRAVRFNGNTGDTPDFKPGSTLMLRAGIGY